jgi:O-antigen ligase
VTRRRIRLARAGWRLVAVVGLAALSVVWAADPGMSLRAVLTLVQLLMLAVMGAHVLREPRDVQRVMDVLLVSSAVIAVMMLAEGTPEGRRVTFTFGGESVNANYVAATLVFPVVGALALGKSPGAFGWWRLAAVAPVLVAIFLTGSRGGAAALVAGLLLVTALRRRIGVRLALGAVVLSIAIPLLVPQATVDRLLSRYSTAQEDRLSGRTDIWKVAVAMVEDRPLQGQAYGGFADAFYHYMLTAKVDPHFARLHSRGNRAAHNIYLGVLAELGVVGLVVLLAALAAHGRALWRSRVAALRRGDEATARLALALIGVFTSILVFGATIDLLGNKATWVWFALMQATMCLGLPEWARRRI